MKRSKYTESQVVFALKQAKPGTIVGYDDYYAFGLAMPGRSINSANPNDDYKFTGHELDDEAGLNIVHMGARGYDPVIGRMMQVDKMSELYPNVSTYTYALNNPINAIDPDGNIVIFVAGLDPVAWATQRNSSGYYSQGNHMMRYSASRPYPPSREMRSTNSGNWSETATDYFERGFGDSKHRFINASSDNSSQASDRYAEGIKAGKRFLAALESGDEKLAEGETIKLVGHSQGAAFAAGMAAIIQQSEYGGLLESVYYLSAHQPDGFAHPSGVDGQQFMNPTDWVSSIAYSPLMLINGGSSASWIPGVNGRHVAGGTFGLGHGVDTYLDELTNYFRSLGIDVTVIE